MCLKTIGSVMLVVAPLLSARAQNAAEFREGQRVRISSASHKDIIGVVRQIRADSMVLFTEPAGATLAIANSDLRRIDVSRGRTMSQGAKRGALWGGAIGSGMAVIIVASFAGSSDEYINSVGDDNVAALAANMIGGGLVWGAIIGAFVKAERWDHASIQPRVGSSSLGIRIALR